MPGESRMTNEQCFAVWAPDGVLWSQWAKPVTFTQLDDVVLLDATTLTWETAELARIPSATGVALVVEAPGPNAVRLGVGLARIGYRPVPLFNATTGPSQVLDIEPIARRLIEGVPLLEELHLPPSAPPAFLLDAERLRPKTLPIPGKFDNRWVTLPQDFPSGTLLLSRGISQAMVLQYGHAPLQDDLAHVLRRWQDAGVRMSLADLNGPSDAEPLQVQRPSLFRLAWYRVAAMIDLRRADVGGFGGAVPQETSGGGYYG